MTTPTLTTNARRCAGYSDSAVTTDKHRAQEIVPEIALQTSQNEETDRIPFTLTYHPQNLSIKNFILKIHRNYPKTKFHSNATHLGNFLVRSAFKFNNQPGTFPFKRTRRKTYPFISNKVKISGPNRSVKVTGHFTCISTNVIYCITCTLCKKTKLAKQGEDWRTGSGNTYTRPRNEQHRCVQTSRAPF